MVDSLRKGSAHVELIPSSELPPAKPSKRLMERVTNWAPVSGAAVAAVRRVCAAHRLDALVVVYRNIYKDDDQDVYLPWIGIRASNLLGLKTLGTYACMTVDVFDSSGKMLFSRMPNGSDAIGFIRDFSWKESLSEYSPQQRAELKRRMQADVVGKVTEGIHETRLGG